MRRTNVYTSPLDNPWCGDIIQPTCEPGARSRFYGVNIAVLRFARCIKVFGCATLLCVGELPTFGAHGWRLRHRPQERDPPDDLVG